MARIRWERNKDGKLVPYKPKKFNFADSSVNNHINMRGVSVLKGLVFSKVRGELVVDLQIYRDEL